MRLIYRTPQSRRILVVSGICFCHFSKIEFTAKGEKKHLTFSDTVYGPSFEPLAEAIVREGVCPRIICESDGTMSDDALAMKKIWQEEKNKND